MIEDFPCHDPARKGNDRTTLFRFGHLRRYYSSLFVIVHFLCLVLLFILGVFIFLEIQ